MDNVKSRIIKNLKLQTGYLSLEEFDNSEALWLKYEQSVIMFDSNCNYEKLKHSLNLYEDENNILRLKSRFNSLKILNHNQKNPILLRSHSLFTDLLILKFHEKCCHSGVNATLNSLRTKFWIIRGTQTVKKYLKKCVTCKIVQGKTLKPPDCPSLPKFRLECNHAFENVGLDCAGPLFIKEKGNAQKCYILLFTCAVTRAIHLELCTDVSATVLI